MTTVCFAAVGTYFSEIFPPAEKNVMSAFEKSKFSRLLTSISLSLNIIYDPKLLEDARRYRLVTEKFFLSKISIIFLPTFPVAPTIAIFMVI